MLGVISGLMMIYWLSLPENEATASTEDLKVTIQRVAEDYRKEQWFNEKCFIGSTQVTLAQMLYGLGVAEWGFLNGSAGMRTNNPWSLRKWMWLKDVVNTHNIDNAKTRPEYATMYDWLYEKAHLIASPEFRYKCNYSFESAFSYVNWPRAERTEAKNQNARNHLNNTLRWAMKFVNNPESIDAGVAHKQAVINYYQRAKDQENIAKKENDKAIQYRGDYIKSK